MIGNVGLTPDSTWPWPGGTEHGSIAANWVLVAGPGNGPGYSQSGDTPIDATGTVVTALERHGFRHKDYVWCPRDAGTPLQFDYTRLIAPAQMTGTLKRILRLVEQAMGGLAAPEPAAKTAKEIRS